MPARRSARRLATAAACGLLAAAGTTAPAHAEPVSAAPGPDTPHCIVGLQADSGQVQGDSGGMRCFRTFTAAVEAATGGRVDDAPRSARAAADSRAFRQQADGEVIQGTFFEHPGYGGASLTIYGARPCEKDGWVEFQYDLGDGWKDRISSVQPWANCWLWLYPEPDLGGDRDGPFKENTPDIGSFMNDRTESIGFS